MQSFYTYGDMRSKFNVQEHVGLIHVLVPLKGIQ